MKWLPLFLFLLVLSFGSNGQNILSNGSFEQYNPCPLSLGQIQFSTGWNRYGQGSSDYYNSCGTTNSGVPTNYAGSQVAAQGVAYSGVILYSPMLADYKEYITTSFQPLTTGMAYEVSMSVSLADKSGFATDDIRAFFFINSTQPSNNATPAVVPQIDYRPSGIITNTTDWIRLIDTFVADSPYSNIVVGAFQSNTAINVTPVSGGTIPYAYYYIDSIVVRQITPLGISLADTLFCIGDTITAVYTIAPNRYNINNIFSLQLSDNTGSFNNPITIGQKTSNSSAIIKGNLPLTTVQGNYYKIRVVSSNPADTFVFSKSIAIAIQQPSTPVTSSNSPVCTNDTLKLQATSQTTGVTWSWTGPDNFSSVEQNPIIDAPGINKSGQYIVTARTAGCVSKDTISIVIKQAPQPITISTPKDTICEFDTLKLFVTPTESGVSYSWIGPGGFNASNQNPVVPFAPSSYSGKIINTATKNGCTERDTVQVLIKPAPLVNALNNGPLCSNATLNLSTTVFSPGTSYSWTGPGGYSSILINPIRTNTNNSMSGDYIVKGELNGCFNYDTTTVLIYPVTPTPTTSNNSPICAGGDIKLNASAIANASYEWNGPGLFYSTDQNAIRSNAALVDGGTYNVIAKVNGCASAPVNTIVTVAKGPEILVYPNPGDSICPGWSVSFAAVPKNAGSTQSFEWFRNGTSTSATGQTYNAGIPNSGDSFYVRMIAGSVCNTPINSSPVRITVLPVHTPPTISIIAEPGPHVWPGLEVKFKAQTGNAGAHPGYQWRRNGQDIPNAKDSILKADYFKTGDTICCMVSSNYLCAVPRDVLSNCLVMNVDAGIENTDKNVNIKVYPNPNDGNFIIESKENTKLQICNMQGQVVLEQELRIGVNTIRIPQQLRGIYILRISNLQRHILIQKITIE